MAITDRGGSGGKAKKTPALWPASSAVTGATPLTFNQLTGAKNTGATSKTFMELLAAAGSAAGAAAAGPQYPLAAAQPEASPRFPLVAPPQPFNQPAAASAQQSVGAGTGGLDAAFRAAGMGPNTGGIADLAALQAKIDQRYGAMRALLDSQYADRGRITAAEKQQRAYGVADIKSQELAARAAVDNAYNTAHHNNYVTGLAVQAAGAEAGRQNAALYNQAAAADVADAAALSGAMQGGERVAGAAADQAGLARGQAATQGSLANNLSQITSDALAQYSASMDQQAAAQQVAAGNQASDLTASFNQAQTSAENTRMQQQQSDYTKALMQGESDKIAAFGDLGKTQAGFTNSGQESYLGRLSGAFGASAEGKRAIDQAAGAGQTGGSKLLGSAAYGMVQDRNVPDNSKFATLDAKGNPVPKIVSAAASMNAINKALGAVRNDTEDHWVADWSNEMSGLGSPEGDQDLYAAMALNGLTDPYKAYKLFHTALTTTGK